VVKLAALAVAMAAEALAEAWAAAERAVAVAAESQVQEVDAASQYLARLPPDEETNSQACLPIWSGSGQV